MRTVCSGGVNVLNARAAHQKPPIRVLFSPDCNRRLANERALMDVDQIAKLKKISQQLKKSVIRELSGSGHSAGCLGLLMLWRFCIFMPCD